MDKLLVTGWFLLLGTGTALAGDGGKVEIPLGDWIVAISQFVGQILVPALLGAAVWAGRMISPALGAWLAAQRTAAVEQLLQRAVDYGLNAVAGAAKGKVLTVDVGSQVLGEALGYAVRQGPGKLLTWVGGTDALQRMILARLHLDENATRQGVGLPPV